MYSEILKPEIIKGVKLWKNPKNKFNVFMLHYSADPEKDPERNGAEWYKNEMIGVPEATRLKEYEISFATKSGKLIFGKEFCDFEPSIHLIDSFEVGNVEFLLSLDFGQRNPTAALVGAWTREGDLFIIDEYYKPALPSVSSREIFDKFSYIIGDTTGKSMRAKRDMARLAFQTMVIDPTTASKNRSKIIDGEEQAYSVIEDFYDNGLEFAPGINDVDTSITRIREYFQIDENRKSHLYIFKDKCPYLASEIQKYRYKEHSDGTAMNQNKSESPVKKDDHGVDSLRYMIMTRPHSPRLAPKEKTLIQKDVEKLLKPKAFGGNWDNDTVI